MSNIVTIFLTLMVLVISKLSENNATLLKQGKEENILKNYPFSTQERNQVTSPSLKDIQTKQQLYKRSKYLQSTVDKYSKILNNKSDGKTVTLGYILDGLTIKNIVNYLGILNFKNNNKINSYGQPDMFYKKPINEKASNDFFLKSAFITKDNDEAAEELFQPKAPINDSDKSSTWYEGKSKRWSKIATMIRSGSKITKEMPNSDAWSELFQGENDLKNKMCKTYLKPDEDGFKMLLSSIVKGDYSLTKFLVDCGFDLKSPKNGNSHLWLLLSRGNFELVDYMISKGADIKMQDTLGLTLLHKAALLDERKTILEFLLTRGLDVNIQSKLGLTPLDISNGGAWTYLKERGGKTSREFKRT